MKRLWLALAIALCVPLQLLAEEAPLPRILAAPFDSHWESTPRPSQIHRFMEMPANYLGYDVQYYDVSTKLPDLGSDVAGVLIWFDIGTEVPDPDAYLTWLEKAQSAGKKLIIIENSGLSDRQRSKPEIMRRWNKLLAHIGIQDDSRWNQVTYHAAVTSSDPDMMNFERKVEAPLPPLTGMHVMPGSHAKSHLQVRLSDGGDEDNFDLVITAPEGGYIAPSYALYEEDEVRPGEDQWTSEPYFLWYVNPFKFLEASLGASLQPIPDVTTLDGRRIFYSHIDGDGWNNISEIPPYVSHASLAAEVIYNEILKPYNDFAFNVALITGDIDPDCYGVANSLKAAREIYALPNVEPATHTYSHPLFWEFFANYNPQAEEPYLKRYPPKPKDRFSLTQTVMDAFSKNKWGAAASPDSTRGSKPTVARTQVKRGLNEESVDYILKKYYDTPRSFACSPFDLKQEIQGSVATIDKLLPPGKKVRLIQWSGDTSPFEGAIRMSREAHLLNINGGDSRFDKEYPSYSYVAPIGLKVGSERQIYSSNSNEDTYTNLWTERFYGYKYLQKTVENTESPLRVSPFNVYFHIFSGEKQASLNAVKENLEYARKQDIISITATDYASIAEGFYSMRAIAAGKDRWKIIDRGSLNTLRLNHAEKWSVDFARSEGVLGQRYFQGNLYVALDPDAVSPALALKNNAHPGILPVESRPYLVESKWIIRGLKAGGSEAGFMAQGYGKGSMVWRTTPLAVYTLSVPDAKGRLLERQLRADKDGTLAFDVSAATSTSSLAVMLVENGAVSPAH